MKGNDIMDGPSSTEIKVVHNFDMSFWNTWRSLEGS